MQLTDNYQLTIDPDNPPHKLYEKFTWTIAESTQWTDFRTQADALFSQYDSDLTVNTTIRNKMHTLIRQTNEYDHDRDTGHHLLDKVALHGNIDDCNIFKVKRLTSLADDTRTPTGDLGMLKPKVTIRDNNAGEHELEVTNPDTPDSSALPDGVSHALVFRCVKEAGVTPASIEDYYLVGTAKRGLFLYTFSDMTFDPAKKYFIWYIARYISKTGQIGEPSTAVKGMVIE
jgi:Fe-S-cluster formation regulator IscX/YfhJ